jgi:uncharacterized protein (TIGR02246 family)
MRAFDKGARMNRIASWLFLLLAAGTGTAAPEPPERSPIATLLDAQAEAWTRGDLDAFCSVYAEDATFVTPTGMTQGRQGVLDRYRAKYKDKAGMGALTLTVVETRELGADAASVVARWKLAWPDKPEASGLTLIVFVKSKAGWRIVQDASM